MIDFIFITSNHFDAYGNIQSRMGGKGFDAGSSKKKSPKSKHFIQRNVQDDDSDFYNEDDGVRSGKKRSAEEFVQQREAKKRKFDGGARGRKKRKNIRDQIGVRKPKRMTDVRYSLKRKRKRGTEGVKEDVLEDESGDEEEDSEEESGVEEEGAQEEDENEFREKKKRKQEKKITLVSALKMNKKLRLQHLGVLKERLAFHILSSVLSDRNCARFEPVQSIFKVYKGVLLEALDSFSNFIVDDNVIYRSAAILSRSFFDKILSKDKAAAPGYFFEKGYHSQKRAGITILMGIELLALGSVQRARVVQLLKEEISLHNGATSSRASIERDDDFLFHELKEAVDNMGVAYAMVLKSFRAITESRRNAIGGRVEVKTDQDPMRNEEESITEEIQTQADRRIERDARRAEGGSVREEIQTQPDRHIEEEALGDDDAKRCEEESVKEEGETKSDCCIQEDAMEDEEESVREGSVREGSVREGSVREGSVREANETQSDRHIKKDEMGDEDAIRCKEESVREESETQSYLRIDKDAMGDEEEIVREESKTQSDRRIEKDARAEDAVRDEEDSLREISQTQFDCRDEKDAMKDEDASRKEIEPQPNHSWEGAAMKEREERVIELSSQSQEEEGEKYDYSKYVFDSGADAFITEKCLRWTKQKIANTTGVVSRAVESRFSIEFFNNIVITAEIHKKNVSLGGSHVKCEPLLTAKYNGEIEL